MLKTLFLLAFACLAIIVGPYLADSQGFVHIATNDYVIETSLTTALIILTVSFFVLYIAVYLCNRFLRLPKGTVRWFHLHSARKSLYQQDEAYLAYEEGDYHRTLALIRQSANIKDLPVKALFVGAKSAFNIGKFEEAREFLDVAQGRSEQAKIAASIVRAKLNLRIDNSKAALEQLDSIKSSFKNKLIYKLYYECYKRDYDIERIYDASAQLLKFKLITEADVENIYRKYFEKRIKDASTADDMKSIWQKMSKKVRQDPSFLGPFVNKLLQLGDLGRARKISLETLKRDVSPVFLNSIETWDISIPEVLAFLKKFATDNAIASQVNLPLLKALGNLEFRASLMQDALDHYLQALELSKTPDIYNKIGQILAGQQNFAEATSYFSKALTIKEQETSLSVKALS